MKDSTLGFGLCGIVIIAMATKYGLTGNPFLLTTPLVDKGVVIRIMITLLLALFVLGSIYSEPADKG